MTTSTKQYTNMDYKTITKNIKKITNKTSSARPILQNMYLDNNTIVATDSHRLISINYKHDQTNQLIDPKTNKTITSENNYPSVERLIPLTENANNIININSNEIDLIISVLKAYKHLKISRLKLSLNDDLTEYELNMNIMEFIKENNDNLKKLNLTYKLNNKQLKDEKIKKLYINVDYFLHAMEFIKDYNKTTPLNNYSICIYDKFKPILFTTENNDFKYIVCPARSY